MAAPRVSRPRYLTRTGGGVRMRGRGSRVVPSALSAYLPPRRFMEGYPMDEFQPSNTASDKPKHCCGVVMSVASNAELYSLALSDVAGAWYGSTHRHHDMACMNSRTHIAFNPIQQGTRQTHFRFIQKEDGDSTRRALGSMTSIIQCHRYVFEPFNGCLSPTD